MNPIIFPLEFGGQGPPVADLQDALLLFVERHLIRAFTAPNRPTAEELAGIAEKVKFERTQSKFGDATGVLVRHFQVQQDLGDALGGVVETKTATAVNAELDRLGVFVAPTPFVVSGRVYSEDRAGTDGLRVLVVDRKIAGDLTLGEATTDSAGRYIVAFAVDQVIRDDKSAPDVQVRVADGASLLGVSEVRYDATSQETLDVVLPVTASSALLSEHASLIAAITRHHSGRLGDLQESAELAGRQDISYLANKTGWDARAVAMGALADQFSARTSEGAGRAPAIAPEWLYALFRAGLPAKESVLYQADASSVTTIWKQAIEQGVIPSTLGSKLTDVVATWQGLAAQRLLTAPPLAGVSSMHELLTASGLPDSQQQQFATLYAQHREDPSAMWTAVGQATSTEVADRLQVDGQLGFLTLDNAPLLKAVRQQIDGTALTDLRQLPQEGFHRPEKWLATFSVDTAYPAAIPGDTTEARRTNYAEFLAAQVRLSYPTAALADLVKTGELPIGSRDGVHAFLDEHQGQFDIGSQPVERYIAARDIQIAPEVVVQLKRLQRVHQITPSDQAMTGLLERGFDAAYQIARLDRSTFVREMSDDVGGADQATLVHEKACQTFNATLNIAVSYLAARNGIELGAVPMARDAHPGVDGGQVLRPVPVPPADPADVVAHATLENLFGATDFCECEHCRSVLSPAAYLVDLLQFIDRDPAAADTAAGRVNPQQALLDRRPDLVHLPLSCDNTNTALPYIDIVNETLEYFIANDIEKLSLIDYTGHDTGETPAEDLMASPQFVLDAAYALVGAEYFPPPLPFNRPLHHARGLFARFGVVLADAMEHLRTGDDLERGADAFGWRDILMERLGLSREEHQILTDSVAVPLTRMYGFAAATADSDLIAALSNAKSYTLRVGVSYEDLVSVLKTRFVNPTSRIRLVDTSSGATESDFGTFELREDVGPGDPIRLGIPAFVRLIRFIRLWRKTGWTVTQTDAAICALYRPDLAPPGSGDVGTVAALDTGFLTLLARLGVAVDAMAALGLESERALLPLLACWSDISSAGLDSLYQQMFTDPMLLAHDTVFAPDADGNVLTDTTQKLLHHGETLRAAFHLTADEWGRIVAALGFDGDTALSIATISAVFRRGWLARAMRLSVRELLALTAHTGLDPFEIPDPTRPALSRLVALVNAIRQSGLTANSALYLMWDHDISGRSTPDAGHRRELARSLRADFADIDDQLRVTEDPGGDVTLAGMTQVYGHGAATSFVALLDDTIDVDVAYTHDTAHLESAIIAADSALAYDEFAHRLSYTGLLGTADRDALQMITGVSQEFRDAVDALFERSQEAVETFFTRHPELKPLYETYHASTDPVEQKRAALLTVFRPELATRRKRQQALQRISAAASVDVGLAQALLAPDGPPYPLHAAGHESRPVLDDIVSVETPGLEARFYFRDTADGVVDLRLAASGHLDYHVAGSRALPVNPTPGQLISAVWHGRLEAPESGYYNIVIDTDVAAEVLLSVDGVTQPLARATTGWRNAAPLQLAAGRLHDVSLTVQKVSDTLALKWETPKRPLEVIPERYLYPPGPLDAFDDAWVRFLKVTTLASALRLDAAEIAHLATAPDLQIRGDGWLNALPVIGDSQPGAGPALLPGFEALLTFARIKAELGSDNGQLVAVLKDPHAATATPEGALFVLTHWDRDSVVDLLDRTGHTVQDLQQISVLGRIYDVFRDIGSLGIPGAALIRAATNTVDDATIADLEGALRARHAATDWRALIRPVHDALRASRRDALVTYILHQLRADPQTAHIDTAERLFEYFLMDVQMDPCMLTSRIRHALSSVQLFVERCLMNLEPAAALSADTARQWVWMKRYRVWEANRKVFLWPENWLEPELRDDKTAFFKDAEAELQQSDITDESATTVFLNYLAKLDEIAKLEPCGTYYVEPTATTEEIIHVVARTAGARRKYYSRRHQSGSWTPWERIKLDIEDNPVVPYVWDGRLLLFWLRLIKSVPDSGRRPPANRPLSSLTTSDLPGQEGVQVDAVLCWSEYYNGMWQPANTSALERPTSLDTVFTDRYDRDSLRLAVSVEGDALRVCIKDAPTRFWRRGRSGGFELCQIWPGSFLFYDSHSLPIRGDDDVTYLGVTSPTLPPPPGTVPPTIGAPVRRELIGASDTAFTLRYVDSAGSELTRDILRTRIPFMVVTPRHQLSDMWSAPMLFADSRHAFRVSTSQKPVRIGGFGGFGLPLDTGGVRDTAIPALVLQSTPRPRPKVWADGDGLVADRALIDRSRLKRLVSEDAYIQRALPDTTDIRFGDRVIGPSGARPEIGTDR